MFHWGAEAPALERPGKPLQREVFLRELPFYLRQDGAAKETRKPCSGLVLGKNSIRGGIEAVNQPREKRSCYKGHVASQEQQQVRRRSLKRRVDAAQGPATRNDIPTDDSDRPSGRSRHVSDVAKQRPSPKPHPRFVAAHAGAEPASQDANFGRYQTGFLKRTPLS